MTASDALTGSHLSTRAGRLPPAGRAAARNFDVQSLYAKVRHAIPSIEWPVHAEDIEAILHLKESRNAVILAHNYQTPEIYHCVADLVGDSLALAREATKVDADVIVLAGVHFMAETAKLLNPGKKVLIPDVAAGCSLAESITPEDVRALRRRLSRRAGRHLCEHVGRREGGVRHLLHVGQCPRRSSNRSACRASSCCPDEYLARNIAAETGVEIITWAGHCEVHERFSADDVQRTARGASGRRVLAHPECPPDVVAAADFAGSTAAMAHFVEERRPHAWRCSPNVR